MLNKIIEEAKEEFNTKFVSFEADGSSSYGAGLKLAGGVDEIKDFLSHSLTKGIQKAMKERDREIINKIQEYRCHMDEVHCSCMDALVGFINSKQ